MRAAAILFVVGSHALWVFPEADGPMSTLLRLSGVMGVEIFFVLSGFLIGRILFRIFTNEYFKTKHLTYFLIRRWFRTLPNYYLVLLINIVVVLFIGRELPDSLPLYFGFLQNFNFGMDIFFTESWSLPIEEFAYVIGPLLFYLVLLPSWKISKKKLFLWITLGIVLFFTMTKIWYNHQTGSNSLEYWNINLKAVVIYRIDAIYYGVLAAYISMVYTGFWKKYTGLLFVSGVLLFMTIHMVLGSQEVNTYDQPFFFNVLYLPLVSISISMSLPFFSRLKRVPSGFRNAITFISLISYSMYLLHYSIVLQLMSYFFASEEFTTLQKWAFSGSYLLVTVLLSYLLYRLFEKPFMDIRDRGYFRRKYDAQ
jgi:peptidoglycan/LPS O-acetylase OafA/YrhL